MKTVILTLIEGNFSQSILVRHLPNTDAAVELRKAVAKFAKTIEGKKAWKESGYDFNWGDLIFHCDEILEYAPAIVSIEDVPNWDFEVKIVNHDEPLMPPDWWPEEEPFWNEE